MVSKGRWLRIGIVGLGVVLFVLLWLADKTNLNNRLEAEIASTADVAGASSSLPPLAPESISDGLLLRLSEVQEGEERTKVLDSLVNRLVERNRLAYAAQYAAEKASITKNDEDLYLAGKLSFDATHLSYVQADSSLFRTYSQKAISLLEEVKDKQPSNLDALFYLGLAYVESGQMQNSMRGIQTIRAILDQDPDNLNANFQLGKFSLQTGQLEKAEQRLLKVLEIAPDYTPASLELVQVYTRQGNTGKARNVLEGINSSELDTDEKALLDDLMKSL